MQVSNKGIINKQWKRKRNYHWKNEILAIRNKIFSNGRIRN